MTINSIYRYNINYCMRNIPIMKRFRANKIIIYTRYFTLYSLRQLKTIIDTLKKNYIINNFCIYFEHIINHPKSCEL
jgi:hypothetical protein